MTTFRIPGCRWRVAVSSLLGLGLLLALTATAEAATYYVDRNLTTDCTAGNYSIANRTCSGLDGKAWNTIQEAANVVVPGDTVLVRAGTYGRFDIRSESPRPKGRGFSLTSGLRFIPALKGGVSDANESMNQ